MSHALKKKWNTYVWKRPKDVYGEGDFCLFDKIDPSDISQGSCGDCYFLASLSSLAEFPNRIQSIFLTKSLNDAGCYAVELTINGEKRTVVVDDRFPYDQQKEDWAMSRTSKSREIWVLILEKAFAKVFGSYQRIESGNTSEALYPLTGCPTKFFLHRSIDPPTLYSYIKRSNAAGYVMATACVSKANEKMNSSPADMKAEGLVDNHAYSLLSIKTVTDHKTREEVKLLQLRNPYGFREWKGDWSD